jgi:hypothetical protein
LHLPLFQDFVTTPGFNSGKSRQARKFVCCGKAGRLTTTHSHLYTKIKLAQAPRPLFDGFIERFQLGHLGLQNADLRLHQLLNHSQGLRIPNFRNPDP